MGDGAGSPPATWAQPERETETGPPEVVSWTFVTNEDFLRSGDNLDSIEGVSAAVCGAESGACQPRLVGAGRMAGGGQQDQPREGPPEDMDGCEASLIASEKDVVVLDDRSSGRPGTSKLSRRVATPDTNDTMSIGSSADSSSVRHVTPDDSSVEEGTDTHGVGGATCGQGFGQELPADPPDDSLDSIQLHGATEEAPPGHDCNHLPVPRGQTIERDGIEMEAKQGTGSIGRYRMASTRGRFGGRRDKASRKRGGPGFQMVSSSGFPGVSWNRRMGAWLAFYYDSQARRSRTFHPKHFNNDVEQARIAAIQFKISVGDTEPKRQPCRYAFLPGSEDELMPELGVQDTGAHKMYGQQRPPGSRPDDCSAVVAESAPVDSAVLQNTPCQSECKGSGAGGAVPSLSQLHEPICGSTLMCFTGTELNTAQLQSLPSYGDWVHPETASTLLPWDLGQQLLKDGNSSERRGQPSTSASGPASTSRQSEVRPETNEVAQSKDAGFAGNSQVLSSGADAGTTEPRHPIPVAARDSLYRKAAGTEPSPEFPRLLAAETISRPVDQPHHLWINSGMAGGRLLASGGNLDLTVLAEGRRGDARKRLRTQCRSSRDDVHAPLQAECLMRSGRRGSEEPGTPFFKLASAEMVPRNLTSGSASGVPSLPCDTPYEQLGDPFSLNWLPACGEWALPIAPPGAAEISAVEAGGLTDANPC